MSDSADMILPVLREMRAEMQTRFDGVDGRLDRVDRRIAALEAAQVSFRQALGADSLMSKLITGEFEERIEALERRVRELEGQN
jgi:polyhydroxyalkanoate synthesis regulator phasin